MFTFVFKKIDSICLPFFQKISDTCQLLVGINNFAIGRIILIFDAAVIVALETILAFNSKHYIQCIVLGIINPLVLMYFWRESYENESLCQNKYFKNPYEIIYAWWRGFWAILSVVNFIPEIAITCIIPNNIDKMEMMLYYIKDIDILFESIALYFLSCTPKPPSKSKLKKIISALKETVVFNKEPAGYART